MLDRSATLALEKLSAVGPFFDVTTHPPQVAAARPWRMLSELVTDPVVLRERVGAVRTRLATSGGLRTGDLEVRVAASVTQLGLVARIVSVSLGLALITGSVTDLGLADLRWQPTLGGAFPLSIPETAIPSISGTRPDATVLAAHLLSGPVSDINRATAAFSVSSRILCGNVASAIHGATALIVAAHGELADTARYLTDVLMATPPLTGAGTVDVDGQFHRHSCCLIYRAAPPPRIAVCADCILRHSR